MEMKSQDISSILIIVFAGLWLGFLGLMTFIALRAASTEHKSDLSGIAKTMDDCAQLAQTCSNDFTSCVKDLKQCYNELSMCEHTINTLEQAHTGSEK